jgi:Ion channel
MSKIVLKKSFYFNTVSWILILCGFILALIFTKTFEPPAFEPQFKEIDSLELFAIITLWVIGLFCRFITYVIDKPNKLPVVPIEEQRIFRFEYILSIMFFCFLSFVTFPIIDDLFFNRYAHLVFLCYLVVISLILYLTSFVYVLEGIIKEYRSLSSGIFYLFFINVAVILLFASLYSFEGIKCNGDITKRFTDSIYFSAVTFTSLGYGDCRPENVVRLFAAIEALVGYLFLGSITAVVIKSFELFKKKENSK